MCYFMYGITRKGLDAEVIEEYDQKGLFIRDESTMVRDAKPMEIYYKISNGHCACDIVISPFDKVEEVKAILGKMSSSGSFRFVIIDSEYEDGYLEFSENSNFETALSKMPQEKISINEILDKYPNFIEHDKVYEII